MLIRQLIERAKLTGDLVPFIPPIAWSATPRAFLMTKRLATQITDSIHSPDARTQERWERLRADISHFVAGGLVTSALMKMLDPPKYEHWELRSVRPKPSIRVFGRFAEPNVFIGTHAEARSKLGGKWSLDWELAKLECEDEWKAALGEAKPFAGKQYTDYITENAKELPEVPL